MPYTSLENGTGYLTQLRVVPIDASALETFAECIDRAAAIINLELDINDDLATPAEGEVIVYGNGLQTLPLPPLVAGSVTEVTAPAGHTIPDYIEQEGALVLTDSTGIVLQPYRAGLSYSYGTSLVWQYGVPYTVAATFGHGDTVMRVLEQANLEGAVALWRYKDSGGSQEIGEGDAVVVVRDAWSPKIARGLERIRQRVHGNSAGIH